MAGTEGPSCAPHPWGAPGEHREQGSCAETWDSRRKNIYNIDKTPVSENRVKDRYKGQIAVQTFA